MSVALVTGSGGLVGSEAAAVFGDLGYDVVGIDNDMRRVFFGEQASTRPNRVRLQQRLKRRYRHVDADIRDRSAIVELFGRYGSAIEVVIHAAAQPSHDWAARDPFTDFTINAEGTLNLLEATRLESPDAAFVFMSTNKVYGDRPNALPLLEQERRYEIDPAHPYADGIPEEMAIDRSLHSLFGVSKASADLLVQEYGRYFGMATSCFRAGCITGPNHAGAELHGFLAYLMRCTATGSPYRVFGYKGKQVRDNIHSADLVRAFVEYVRAPRPGQVYNMGGSRKSNCSVLEAIDLCQEIAGRELRWSLAGDNRIGDHIWYISDTSKFEADYPAWRLTYDVPTILQEIHETNHAQWREEAS